MSLKETIDVFKKEGRVIKSAPCSFVICVGVASLLLCAGTYWLVDHLYAAEVRGEEVAIKVKDGTIEQKDSTIETLNTRISVLNGTVQATPEGLAQTKKEASILSGQLFEFVKKWHPDDPYFRIDYRNRFAVRVNSIRNSLDLLGQDSTNLDRMLGYSEVDGFFIGDMDSNYVTLVATEIKTLADNLK